MSRTDSFLRLLVRIASYPQPLRIALLKAVLRRMTWIRYSKRLEFDAVARPNYGFCIYHAALLAKALVLLC